MQADVVRAGEVIQKQTLQFEYYGIVIDFAGVEEGREVLAPLRWLSSSTRKSVRRAFASATTGLASACA